MSLDKGLNIKVDISTQRPLTTDGTNSRHTIQSFSTISKDEIVYLTENDREELIRVFGKYDKRKTGSVNPSDVPDILRLAGQNPTNEEVEKILEDANAPGTMIDVNDLLSIAEKHWKSYSSFEPDLRQACLAFDRNDTGVIEFEDLKNALIKYGDALDDDDIDLLQKALNAGDNKVIVDEFIKILMPPVNEAKKPKKKTNSAKKKTK